MPNVATTTPDINDSDINDPDINASGSSRPGQPLRRELRRRLLALPYRAFLRVAVHLLHAQGYTAARPAGRDTWKGRNTAGGWDAEADFQAGGLGTLHCVAQVKQFDTLVVAQRQVDELRGAAMRAAAHQAVLVTLSTFSPPARKAAQSGAPVAPVRLIDGEELLDLLIGARLGVRRGRDGAWALDEVYFEALHRFSPPHYSPPHFSPLRGACVAGLSAARWVVMRNGGRLRALSVTVSLDPPDGSPLDDIRQDGLPKAGVWRWEPERWEPDMDTNSDMGGEPQ